MRMLAVQAPGRVRWATRTQLITLLLVMLAIVATVVAAAVVTGVVPAAGSTTVAVAVSPDRWMW